MEISVVIVNYRVKYFLEQTIASVLEAMDGISGEVIVVDNCSGDDSIEHSRRRFGDRVTFVENIDNVGFARANNQAIACAQGEYTLVLNPDTIIHHSALSQCLEWMRTHENCGAIGVRMLDANGHFLPESKRAFPTPWVSFCKIFGLSKFFPKSRVFAKYHLRYLDEHSAHKVDILAGAFMFCRTDVLRNLGGFDEDFFMYGEDIDLSYRIVKAGRENWYLPVPIIHYKGESTKKESMRYVEIFYGAMLIFYKKHFPRFGAVAYPIIKAGVWVRKTAAKLRRLVIRLLPKRATDRSKRRWVIPGRNGRAIAAALGLNEFEQEIPDAGHVQVVLDDELYSYAEIVALIDHYASLNHDFHIYSHTNQMLITPKMSQQ